MSFAHLRIHTHYSVNDSIVKLPELFARATELRLDAIAITDPSVMSGVPEFLSLSLRYPEIKPIIGCEFNLTNPSLRNSHEQINSSCSQLYCLPKTWLDTTTSLNSAP